MDLLFQKSIFKIKLPFTDQKGSKLEYVRKVCLWLAIAIAVVILAAWLSPFFRQYYPTGWDLMKANTAVCILLTALFLFNDEPLSKSPWQGFIPIIIFVTAGSALYTHLTGVYIRQIHDLLIINLPESNSGLMSLQTSIFFITFSVFILVQKSRLSTNIVIPTVGGIIFFAYVVLLASGYFFHALALTGQSTEIRTSPHTLIAMILLVLSYVMYTMPNSLFSILTSKNDSGKMVRQLLPWALIVPYTILFIGYRAFYLSMVPSNTAAALVGTFTSTIIGILIILFGYKINSLHDQLSKLAVLDPLTGCYNQRGFFTLGLEFSRRKTTSGAKIGLIYFDLDKLKQVNDSFGHETGSNLIIDFVNLIKMNIRDEDILGRLGGDEFGLIVNESAIPILLERITSAADEFNQRKSAPYAIQFSYGVAAGEVTDAGSFEQLVNEADKAMYQQKMSKR